MGSFIRGAVSKKKRRYQKNGFDLDLTYVTPRIVAMGFPSENVEAAFRNPMKEVLRFLDSFHKDHYKVYNLCSERNYDHEKFYNRVEVFPFDDHNAPPFELIALFCQSVEKWLGEDEKNVAVIHCKAGKGRTGLMISAWMLYSKEWATAKDALTFYAAMRTYNQKGVTIPSQIRYVYYFAESLQNPPENKTLLLNKVTFHTLPKVAHIPDINFHVHVGKTLVFTYKDHEDKFKKPLDGVKKKTKKGKKDGEDEEEEETAVFECGNIPVFGDINVEFTEKSSKIFAFWFSSLFVKENRLILKKEELDKAHKDTSHKNYSPNFRIELSFLELSPDQAHEHASASAAAVVSDTPAPASTSADASSSLSSSSSSPIASPSESMLRTTAENGDAEKVTSPELPGIALAAVANGEWVLNKDTHPDEQEGTADDPNILSEKLITMLLVSCKVALRGSVLIDTHTAFVRGSAGFQEFQSLVPRLARVSLAGLSATASLAFWLNVHNMLTLHSRVLLAETPKKKDGVLALRHAAKYRVGGRLYSGSDIEVGVIRAACNVSNESPFVGATFAVDDARKVYISLQHESRVIFALYRGTESCPHVRMYSHRSVHEDLDEAAKHFLDREVFAAVTHNEVWVPKMLFWYRYEFGHTLQGVKDLVQKYVQIPMPEYTLKFNSYLWEFEMHPWYVEEKARVSQTQLVKEDEREKRHKKEKRKTDSHRSSRDVKVGSGVESEPRREPSDRDMHRKEKKERHNSDRDRDKDKDKGKEKGEEKEKEKEKGEKKEKGENGKEKEKGNKDKDKDKDKDRKSRHSTRVDHVQSAPTPGASEKSKHKSLRLHKDHKEKGENGKEKEKDREDKDGKEVDGKEKVRDRKEKDRDGKEEKEKDGKEKGEHRGGKGMANGKAHTLRVRTTTHAPPPKESSRKSVKVDSKDSRRMSL